MVSGLTRRRSPLPVLAGAAMLALACGAGTDGPGSPSPSPTVDPAPVADPQPQAETPGPWAPSRALAVDRFALETAVGSALAEPVGGELTDSTVWTLAGENVELRFQVRTWFNGAEAELACRAAAGSGAEESLALGTPVWTAADAVYVTVDAACIRVTVTRGATPDGASAGAVAGVLVSGA
jgi:hypothetical protein